MSAETKETPSRGNLEFFATSSDFTINGGNFINISAPSSGLASGPKALNTPDFGSHLVHLEKRFRLDVDKLSDNDIYTLMMLQRQKGYPLWDPLLDNNLPEEYREEGVRIGDVGVLNGDGGFDFLFNICLPASHPINRGRVPPDFKPLECSIDAYNQDHLYPSACSLSSSDTSVQRSKSPLPEGLESYMPNVPTAMRARLKFTASASRGAVLILPEGGSRTYAHNLADFLEYTKLHAIGWYKHASGRLRRTIGNSSLYLVTGCDKARCWGSAVFSRCRPQDVLLTFAPLPGEGLPKYRFEDQRCCTAHSGSNVSDKVPPSGQLPENGCVFMRGFKIAVRSTLFGAKTKLLSPVVDPPEKILDRGSPFRLRGGASSDDSDESDDSGSPQVSITEFTPENYNPFHPSDILNEYVLSKYEHVDVTVIHDNQWVPFTHDLYEPDAPTVNVAKFVNNFLLSFDLHTSPLGPSDSYQHIATHWKVKQQAKSGDILLLQELISTMLGTSEDNMARSISSPSTDSFSGGTSSPNPRGQIWTIEVYVNGVLYGIGRAATRARAREIAAVEALKVLRPDLYDIGPLSYERWNASATTELNNWAQAHGTEVQYNASAGG